MKKVLVLFVVLAMFASLTVTAFADAPVVEPVVDVPQNSMVEPMAEETEWTYRIYNGNLEKRLWSNTYGKWLTDWIYVGPAPSV